MKLKAILSIWTILGLALALRIPYLNGSFWLDEAAQALESARPLSQQLDIIPDFQPPLLHLILHFAMYLGEAEWWLRLVGAVIPGLISIWCTYQIGRKLGTERTGLLAALLLTTSSFHIFYSQELRPYALPMMWGMLSWLLLLSPGKKPWVKYALVTIAGLYSSYLYPFLVIGQALWMIISNRTQLKSLMASLGVAAASFALWLPIFKLQLDAGGEVRQGLPGWESVVSIPQLKSLPLVVGKFIFGVVDLKLSWFFLVATGATVIACSSICYHLWRNKKQIDVSKIKLFTIWLVVPLLTAWFVSFWIPVVQPKRVIYLLPAFYISLIWSVEQTNRKILIRLVACLFLAINLWGITQYYLQPIYQREDWRRLHAELIEDYPEDSVVLFAFPEPYAPWRWYDDGQYPTLVTGQLHISQVADLTTQLRPIHQYRFVIVPDYLRDLSDPNRQLEAEIEAYGYQLVELKDYPNIGFVRIFGRPGATLSKGDL